MSRPSDLFVIVAVVAVVAWLDMPKLLLPVLFISLFAASALRWRRDGRDPMAAARYRARLLAACLVIATISIPLILELVPPNGVYGFRTSVTRSSPDIWYAANAFMGWALLLGAVAGGASLIYSPTTATRWRLLVVFLLPLTVAVVASLVYLARIS